jgi:PAS domain S-box-containing protein
LEAKAFLASGSRQRKNAPLGSMNLDAIGPLLMPALVGANVAFAFMFVEFYSERQRRQEFLRYWNADVATGKLDLAEEGAGTTLTAFLNFLRRHAIRYALVLFFVGLALSLRWFLTPTLQDRLPYTFFLIAVILAVRMGGVWKGLLALVLGFLAGTWFFAQPQSWVATETYDWWAGGLYVVIGVGLTWFLKLDKGSWLRTLRSDIAASKQMQQVRAKHAAQAGDLQELLAAIVQGCEDAILSVTPQGRITSWNSAAERVFEIRGWEAIGQPLSLILPPGDATEPQRLLDAVRRGEPVRHGQAKLKRKGDATFDAVLTVSPILDSSGKAVGASMIVREVPAANRS